MRAKALARDVKEGAGKAKAPAPKGPEQMSAVPTGAER